MLELVVPAFVVVGVSWLVYEATVMGTYFGILPLTLINYSAEVKIVSLLVVGAIALLGKFFVQLSRHLMLGLSFSFKQFYREVSRSYQTPIPLRDQKRNILIASIEGVFYFAFYQSLINAIFITFGVFMFALGDTIDRFGGHDRFGAHYEFRFLGLILSFLRAGDWGSIGMIWDFYVEMLRRPAPKFGFGLATAHLLGVIVGSCAAAWKMSLRLGGIKIPPMLLLVLLVSAVGVGFSNLVKNSVEFAVHDPVKQRLSEELRIELPAGLYAAIIDLNVGEELWFLCPHAAEGNPAREGWIVTEMKRDANQWFVQAPPPDQSLEDCHIWITNGEIRGRRQVWFTAPPSISWKLYFVLSDEIDVQTKRKIIFDEMIHTVYFSSSWFLLVLFPVYYTLKFSHGVRDAVVLKAAIDFLPSTRGREIVATVADEMHEEMKKRLQKQPDN